MGTAERQLRSDQIKAGLARRRAAGAILGRPRAISDTALDLILGQTAAGVSPWRIARTLNETGVPTIRGGAAWSPSTIRGVLCSSYVRRLTQRQR